MPIPRILLFTALGLFAMAVVFWSMNVNFAGWMGAWFSAENPNGSGFALSCLCSAAAAAIYVGFLGKVLPGPPALRGILFGVGLATLTIWVLPYSVSWVHTISGQTRIVYNGDPKTIRDIKSQHPSNDKANAEPTTPDETVVIDGVPNIGTLRPFLAKATRDKPWAAVDDWRGRLLPFGLAFALFGLIIGVALSEKSDHSG
ncbi:hypothetical protein OAU50_08640 [Planctomycetota bacterium]|nr:hypothetical protein [Planctomycetota bacterium]